MLMRHDGTEAADIPSEVSDLRAAVDWELFLGDQVGQTGKTNCNKIGPAKW